MSAGLLAANAGDVVQFVIVAIIILISLIARYLAQVRNVRPPAPPPARRRIPQDQEVAKQIDEFLQRAAQRARPQRATPPAAPPPAVPVETAAEEPVGGRIGRRVREDLDTSDFRRRRAQMGEEVQQADKDFQQRVGQTFTSEVSRLTMRPLAAADVPAAGPEPADTAAEPLAGGTPLASLFSNPESIVSAIILSEILRRPE
jgi:type IV secretory pathway VirB10-like protein